MKTIFCSIAVLTFCSFALAGAKGKTLSILDPSGKEIVSSSDVICASISKTEDGKGEMASFVLNADAGKRVQETTSQNIGKKISVSVCGGTITPNILGEVSIYVAYVGLTKKQKECLGKAFEIRTNCR